MKTVIQGVEKVSNGKLSTTKGIIDHSIDDIKIVIGRDIIGWTQEITYNSYTHCILVRHIGVDTKFLRKGYVHLLL